MSTIGIEGTVVDTLLEQPQHQPGEALHAHVKINTGRRSARIDAIKFAVWSQAGKQEPVQIAHCVLAERLTVAANSEQRVPVQLRLPHYTPISVGGVRTWLQTDLDIPMAPDPQDTDDIDIVANNEQQQVFAALADIGFTLISATIEPLPQQSRYQVPFLQQFRFRADSGCPFAGELELSWEPGHSELSLQLSLWPSHGEPRHLQLQIRPPVKARLESQLQQLLN
ncbi:sporulation protein [Ferrimonas senticii]|uniref:sporulation protein n=1 Tax=Ferrimonas senticii TaxID=394566 RepID=UPI00146BF720|nr:sporulation protein [Ferrimonas senticii]